MDFYQKCEAQDDIYFNKWAKRLNWFSSYERSANRFDRVDFHCVLRKSGKICNCELKDRQGKVGGNTYYPAYFSGIYIEPDKYEYLMNRWKNFGEIPIYINFFNDGQTMSLFDLRKAKILRYNKTVKVAVDKSIKACGYEWVYRHELDIKSGTHLYMYDNPEDVDDYIIQKADVKNWEIAQYKNKQYTDLYYNNPYENGKLESN